MLKNILKIKKEKRKPYIETKKQEKKQKKNKYILPKKIVYFCLFLMI